MHEAKIEGLVEKTRKAVEDANVVCFLGFGYHPENLAPLAVETGMAGRTIVGTAYNLTKAEQQRLNLGRYVDEAKDLTILKFLRETKVLG